MTRLIRSIQTVLEEHRHPVNDRPRNTGRGQAVDRFQAATLAVIASSAF